MYAETLEAALPILKGWRPTIIEDRIRVNTGTAKNETAVAFTQPGTGKLGKRDRYGCDKRGHNVHEWHDTTHEETKRYLH